MMGCRAKDVVKNDISNGNAGLDDLHELLNVGKKQPSHVLLVSIGALLYLEYFRVPQGG